MSYTTTNINLPMCQLRVVPEITVTYKNYRALTIHTSSREYLHSGEGWAALERFKQSDFSARGDIKSEHWNISPLPSPAQGRN